METHSGPLPGRRPSLASVQSGPPLSPMQIRLYELTSKDAVTHLLHAYPTVLEVTWGRYWGGLRPDEAQRYLPLTIAVQRASIPEFSTVVDHL